jgi:hypothetical protein
MRYFAAFLIVLASVATAAIAFPPASVEDADLDSITVSGLDCGTTYDITLAERGSGATHSLSHATDPCPAPPPPVQVGSATVGTGTDSNPAGLAQGYRVPASGTGQVDRLNVYLDGSNTASTVELGIYASQSPTTAGARLGRCVITGAQANAWNRCAIGAVNVAQGTTYWLAILRPSGTSGTIRYRNTTGTGNPTFGSSSGSLAQLPPTWTNGANWGNQNASVYADKGPVAPPPAPDADGDAVPDADDVCPNDPDPCDPPPPPPPATGGAFPIGVWNQDPSRVRGGQVNALNYKNVGVNVFVGLWEFPGGDPAWDTRRMQALKDHGLKVIAGDDPDWIDSRPQFADVLMGYQVGDEPDMLRVNEGSGGSHWPDPWRANALRVRSGDPTREIHGQFGKGFCMHPWVGYDSRGDEAIDFPKYAEATTIVSSDCYGVTDPWETRSWHGIYRYGLSVDNTELWTGGRPMWSFIEASHPFRDSEGNAAANSIADRMPPNLIMPAVWMTVIHGADGIEYFCHDFSGAGLIEDGCLNDPGMPAAMQQANASVQQYADVLRTPDLGGTTVTSTGINPTTLTKVHGGQKYVFAIGEGNWNNTSGQAVDATITVSGTGDGTVTVLGEGRTLPLTGGRFTDHFGPYEHHVYRIG